MHIRTFLIGLFGAILLPQALQAAEAAPLNFGGRYEFAWNHVSLGRAIFAVQETATTYKVHTSVKSKGLVGTFVKHTSDATVDGTRSGAQYHALHYETNYQTRNKAKHVKLTYDAQGHLIEDVKESIDPERPAIPTDVKDKASDLLTTVMLIRSRMNAAVAQGTKGYDMDMYDGRRISHLHFDVIGKEDHVIDFKTRATIHVVASRTPGAGYTGKETDRLKNEPKMNLYFSDDAKLAPLSMEIDYLGTLEGHLDKECAGLQGCF